MFPAYTQGQTKKGVLDKKKKKKKKKKKCHTNPAGVVILVRNMSSRPVLHLNQASSKYSVGYSCYRAETRNKIQTQEGEISPKVEKAKVVILVCDMSSGLSSLLPSIIKIFQRVIADIKLMHNQCQI